MISRKLDLEWKLVLSIMSQIIFLVSSMDLDSESEFISLTKQVISRFNSKPDSESELVSLITQLISLGISMDSDSEPTKESELSSLIFQLVSLKPESELISLIRHVISRFRSLNWEPMQFISWFCNVCRTSINNFYGGYSCIKNGCSYAAHSKCASQSNIWDGEELEGVSEEIEQELEPFVTISQGVIQHFSPQQHNLRLDENTDREYDENKLCQAIYFGNFYSCIECEFILHEKCASLSRRMFHPIHPHLLTLVTNNSNGIGFYQQCSACPRLRTGFFYECKRCSFWLHVQCATISEPLVHESLTHSLFLTPKQGEEVICGVCRSNSVPDTFNCIECDFSMCFGCATLPQQVRYKHDKHMLTLSYRKETSTIEYWCEACDGFTNVMSIVVSPFTLNV